VSRLCPNLTAVAAVPPVGESDPWVKAIRVKVMGPKAMGPKAMGKH
jgi:hypothetical protein